MQTEAAADELVTAVSLPAQPEGARTAYMKYSIRPLDFAIVSVAVRLVLGGGGAIGGARVVLARAGKPTPPANQAPKVPLRGGAAPPPPPRAGPAGGGGCG